MKPEPARSFVVRPRPNPRASLRLFCFPYAGVGASVFRPWAAELEAELEVCAIQLPGRENRMSERPFTSVGPLVDALFPAIRPLLDRPFVFFGHSLGALVAFELARRLRREGAPLPAHLFASGRRAPQLPVDGKALHTLPDPELIEELRRYNGTPAGLLENAELMELMLPLVRADFTIHETYAYSPDEPLPFPVSAFGGLEDPTVSRERLAAWQEQARGAFQLRMFPGDHFYVVPERAAILRALLQDIAPLLPPRR